MPLLITKTYQETAPESAEHGELSDQGIVFEDVPYTIRELVEELKTGGYNREGAEYVYTYSEVADCRTMTECSIQLHLSRSNKSYAKKRRWFDACCRIAGITL